MTFNFLISGGQTGVDRAALDFALENTISCGGWCPAGRWAEDGIIASIYPLKETSTTDVTERTRLNISDSDATLILLFNYPADRGTDYTIQQCELLKKPHFIFRGESEMSQVGEWLRAEDPDRLNIAGPRESEAPGIYKLTMIFLQKLTGY